jgi:hypothetical protein
MTAPAIGENSSSASPVDTGQMVQTGVLRRNKPGKAFFMDFNYYGKPEKYSAYVE